MMPMAALNIGHSVNLLIGMVVRGNSANIGGANRLIGLTILNGR